MNIQQGADSTIKWMKKTKCSFFILFTLTLFLPLLYSNFGYSLPSGAKVESGDVQISQPDANTLNVSASDHAIINWQSFGIAQNEIVNFSQPFSSAAVLNNVTGGEMSVIAGTLNANGNVYLVNPAGIYFSPTAEVNVGGLIASSLSISSQNFLEDKMLFERPDGTRVGAVINAGQIMVARPGAVVAMIGNVVKNEGVIVANLGHVALASGDRVTMSFDSKGLLQVDVTEAVSENAFQDVEVPISSAVENSGKIEANGGTVLLTGDELGQLFERVVNQSGVIEADSVGTYRGRVVLNAGRGSAVVSGEIETRGTKTTGGEIRILGEDVKLLGATLDASGDLGGGTVLVGGDYQGKADTPTAFHTFVDASSVIKADARVAGDGGKVILWSESSTLYYGNISGRGGDESGNGGFAEVSGKIYLDYDGRTDLRAPNGAIGTLLLDPNNITISIGANANMSSSGGDPNTYTTTANSGILNTTTLNAALGLASVVVQTGTAGLNSQPGNITVANTITAPANANNLTLSAHNNIAISTGATIDMSASSGNLTLTADSDASGVGAISRAGTGTIAMGTGTLSMTAGSGIGTSALPMQTTGLTNVSANTGTGGIFITNATSGNINITGLTTTTGAASTGGNISVTNSFAGGSITVSGAITGGANAAGSTGNILLTATGGNIIVNADLTTGNATLADTGAVNAVASGSITLNTGAGAGDVTGIGALITGSAILTGAAGAGADTATSGTITITATSGAIGLSHANALQTGAASRTGAGAGTDTATVGNIVLSSATEINNGTASTAMTFTPGTPSGAATNNFGTLAVTTTSGAAGNAFLSASNQIRLAASTIAKDFQLTTTGSITQTGTQTITGTSSFTAGANAITLATATNNFTGAVSLSNSGANNVSIRDANAIILGTVTVGSGTLTVTAVGITQTGAITQAVAAGTASFAGGAGVVTLTNAGNDFTGSVGITNSGANAVSVTDANAIVLGTMTVGTSTLTVNATGAITQTGIITQAAAAGAVTFNAGANPITLTDASNNFIGAVSLNNSGANDVAIRDVNAIVLGASAVGSGTLTVTAVGITQTGAITQAAAAGTASFVGGAGVVTLTNAGNDFTGSVGITNSGANAVSVTDANAIVLGTMTVGTSTLTVNATGAITQTGIITQAAAAGAVTFNAGANPITLTDASNNFIGAVSLNNSGANDVAIRDVNAIVLGASAVGSGTLTVNASGAITQTGAIIQAAAAGTSTFNAGAGAITLTTATNNFTGAVSLNNSGANSVSIRDTNAIVLGDSAVGSGTLTVTAVGITQTGAITQAAGAGTASFVGGAGVITLTNAANDFTGTVTLSNSGANDVSITDVNALTLGASPTGLGNLTVTVGGTLTISGAVSTAVNAAGSTGNISMTTTAGNIVINANVSTGNASQADSAAVETPTSGSITFVSAGSISGTGSTITGTATITGVVAAGADVVTSGSISLTASGGGIGLSNATALRVGTASRTGAVDDTAVAGSITLSSVDEINNNTASTAMTIAIGAASGATVNTQGTLAVTTTGAAGNIFITSASVLRVDGITTSGASSQTVTLTTTGAVALTLNDVARTLTDDAVTFGTGTGLLTITNTVNPIDVAAGSLILTSNTLTVTGGANTLRGDGGAITIQPSSVGTSIGVAGAAGTLQVTTAINTAMQDGFSSITIGRSNGTGAVTVNAITFKDNVTIRSSAAGGTITVNGALTTGSGTQAGTITLNAGSGVTITNVAVRTEGQAIDINADVDANGTGAITISGAASRIDTTNLGAAPAGANITLRGSGFTSTGPAASITAGTSGAVNFYTSLASTTMGFGGAAGTYNLTDAEIATVGSAGTIRFGEAGVESGAVGVQTVTSPVASAAIEVNSNVGAGSVALDDAGAATALATGGSGNVTVRAGSGGVTATQATGARAEISTTGTISIIASGPVGTATNRIQFLAGQTDVGITTTGATGNVFLGGLGSLSLGACSISGTLDIVTSGAITQSGALTVTGTTTMISGAGTNITLTTAGNSFAGTLTLSGADINVSAGAMMTLGAITATGVITLTTSAGDILDGNGAANNLTAAADSSLTAAGVVGTVADPIEVTITGATLTVEAGARILLVSAVIDGTVTPSNRLLSSGRSPGQIIFNGSILYNPFAEAPPEGSLPSLVGAYTSIDTINQMIIEAKDVQGITTDPFLNKRVWSIAPRRVGLSLRS